jgi:hypothetical protein
LNSNGILFFLGYVLIFVAALVGVSWWDRRKHRTRKPFPEDLKLLRMPGEYLWRRVIETDESEMQRWFCIMLVPMIVGAAMLWIVANYFRASVIAGLVLAVIVFAFSLLLCVRWLQKRLQRRANDYLGFFGERYVAEWLEPLKARGWFVFHDIPCIGATGKFNLDHVAVGPGGIWVVETKTRRKGRARPGLKQHEVVFDGLNVVWPWGEETASLRQALHNAAWLKDWLKNMTGKTFPVWPVLTLPGYLIKEEKLGPVRVVYTKGLEDVVISRGNDVLAKGDIDLVRRQLEAKCRDVEY